MITEFALTIDYSQIFVNVPDLPRPGLLWTPDHTAQGFAWAPGIVCFGVPDPDGPCFVQVDIISTLDVEQAALWAVRVPFEVPSVPLIIGSVGVEHGAAIPQGGYSLIFQALPGTSDYAYVLRLGFHRDVHADFEIIKRGSYLKTDKVLRRDADFA